ncbi:uncharacterized protein LOC62_05G007082 [Vanrija pseudolonga]|uniref:DUF6604 domain-containing protein n=1 Tax=Vanrija pseudolonga TaxID=143232 RepID=A0AAF1BNU6_9TREE|nr:hypothetical protein LOC62_05G007082 [Vanrija pseudolonga]
MTSRTPPLGGLDSSPPSFSYKTYKHETTRLVYWIINTSNFLLSSGPAGRVPTFVFALFQSVIAARRQANSLYEQLQASGSRNDPNLEKYNSSHRHFIDSLQAGFDMLGGPAWAAALARGEKPSEEALSEEDIFTNRFALLRVEDDDDGDDDEPADESPDPTPSRTQPRRKANGKGKKGKRAPKAKASKSQPAPEPEPALDIPLESYGLISEDDDYYATVFMLVMEWGECRAAVQSEWRDVAYNGLNAAVAGAVSNAAVARVKRSKLAVFEDFPDRDSYDTVLRQLGGDDLEAAQDRYTLYMSDSSVDMRGIATIDPSSRMTITFDIKEQLLAYAYRDLVDFAVDFQHNRTGKPTKRMEKELRNWDPTVDLRKATKEERLAWCRVHTIKWLYDLVNLFSHHVVQDNRLHGKNHVYEDIDWSPAGPWALPRRMFGLNEFAGAVTSLAFQKPGTDLRRRIQPHLVFQLQCIVDSMTTSRGWSHNVAGHALEAPATDFHARRDVDLFLDRDNERLYNGALSAMAVTHHIMVDERGSGRRPGMSDQMAKLLDVLKDEFVSWLGECEYMVGIEGIAPSQFTSTNPNGLHEYSPYLCGVGLVEALQLVYQLIVHVWDVTPDIVLLMHVHNKLVQTGQLKPVAQFEYLGDGFANDFFADGIPPTKAFGPAAAPRLKGGSPRDLRTLQKQRNEVADRADYSLTKLFDPSVNLIFKTKSPLVALGLAGWDVEAVPEVDMDYGSTLFTGTLARITAKYAALGAKRLPDTDIMMRARANGVTDERLLSASATGAVQMVMGQIRPDKSSADYLGLTGGKELPRDTTSFSATAALQLVRMMIEEDLTGIYVFCRSKLNLFTATIVFFMTSKTIQTTLRQHSKRLHDEFSEAGLPLETAYTRVLNAVLADNADPVLLRAVTAAFDSGRDAAELQSWFCQKGKVQRPPVPRRSGMPDCVVM